jgi:hypothetical protein
MILEDSASLLPFFIALLGSGGDDLSGDFWDLSKFKLIEATLIRGFKDLSDVMANILIINYNRI